MTGSPPEAAATTVTPVRSADTPGGADFGLTVVMIVHGRHAHLRRSLAALTTGGMLPSEIVVVAMADAQVAGVAAEVGAAAPGVDLRVVELDADPARLPLALARNTGAAAARGEVLVFLDVDCLADPALLARYADAARRVRELPRRCGALGAADPPTVLAGPVTYLPEGVLGPSGTPLDWTALRALRSPHAARPDPLPGELVRAENLDLFWSLSFAVTAADYARLGGFDTAYTGYGGEDTDFARRLGAHGGRLWWVGGADAYHQHHPVSRPPLEHVEDIVRNTNLFRARWGEDAMGGWLAAFAERGLIAREADGTWTLTDKDARG